MSCDRCGGLCVKEWIDERLPKHTRPAWWWRCAICGERMDATILRNRAEQEAVAVWHAEGLDRDRREWAALFASLANVH